MSEWLNQFDLNKTVKLYHITHTISYGAATKTRTLYATVQGAAWQVGASEALIAEQMKNPYSMTLVIKPISGVLSTDEIYMDSTYYTIARPDNILTRGDVMQIQLQPLTI